jgi:DNA-binding transcriptional LysR family regulator
MDGVFRVGFVTGATPDKWARTWRDRHPRSPLELVPVEEDSQEEGVRGGVLDMCLMRLPVDRDGLHCIPLYDEQPVVVAGREHWLAAGEPGEEVALADLAEEQLVLPERSGWTPEVPQLDWPAMTPKDAIEVVASGTGVVVVPQSVARLYARRDVVTRPVGDAAPTTVGLVWLVENEDQRVGEFVGIVRGRTPRSSRG